MMDQRKNTYLSFQLGNEIFAISVEKVLEVLEMQKITKVPKAPDFIKGLINFRGEILPVVDTRIKFNIDNQIDQETLVIIVLDLKYKDKSVILGAMVDAVKDVIDINFSEIKSVPDMGSKYNPEYLSGMWRNENGFIMLLDLDKVFSIDELTIKTQNESETMYE